MRCASPAALHDNVRAFTLYRRGWIDFAAAHTDGVMLISFEMLSEQGHNSTLRAALEFWGLPVYNDFREAFLYRTRWHPPIAPSGGVNRTCHRLLLALPERDSLVRVDPDAWLEYNTRNDELRGHH